VKEFEDREEDVSAKRGEEEGSGDLSACLLSWSKIAKWPQSAPPCIEFFQTPQELVYVVGDR
jgi:hypothetical protein